MVYLVGAGPGDPGLITVRGLECIRRADVLVYDYLASKQLVREARPEAERIYVGKRAGAHTLKQDEINALLVEKAKEGKTVVRLKGGDPFVFGRGGEEALALVEAAIPFEVVPGVTSGIAGPAYAGIPVTHRGLASMVTMITGHEDPTKEKSDLDWERISGAKGTLVFFMGVRNLPGIVERLIGHGRDPTTPVALVRWGTTVRQETLVGTLVDIGKKAECEGFKPPALIVVGEVVGLRDRLNWFERRPLFGRKIVVTRSRTQASELVQRLEELGAEAMEMPTIRIDDPEDWGPADEAISELGRFDWIVFTSVNGVDRFFGRLFALGKDVRHLGGIRCCAIGPATAERLRQYHVQADLRPEKYVAESILEAFRGVGEGEREKGREGERETPPHPLTPSPHRGAVDGIRVLLPRTDRARETLPEGLRKSGAEVEEVTVYRTMPVERCAEEVAERFEREEIDAVTFASSSTVRNFVEMVGTERARRWLNDVLVASIGPITTGTARDLGVVVGVEAEEYTIPGLVEAIVRYWK